MDLTNIKRLNKIIIFTIILILFASSCGPIPKIIVLHDPLTPDEHITLGLSYERNGEFDFALKEYNRALKMAEGDVRPYYYAGNVYYKKKDYKRAEKYYNNALKIKPDTGDIHNNLAWVYIDTGRYEDAARETEKALTTKKSPYYLNTLAHVYYRIGKYKEALDILNEAIAHTPEDDNDLRNNEYKLLGELKEKMGYAE